MGFAGAILVLVILWEGFETIILPRRVIRRLRLTRLFYRYTWRFWSWVVSRVLPKGQSDELLSFYGPLSLLLLIVVWAFALILGFGALYWCADVLADAGSEGHRFLTNLYFSGTTFFTLGLGDLRPATHAGRFLTAAESGLGFGFLALVVSYLPALNAAFSRREVNISMLDARAGSPPTALEMLRSHVRNGSLEELTLQLAEWERWAAELLESHLSYPVLAYYRSQHDNQSWLGALAAILDSSAFVLAALPEGTYRRQAELTFAISRHAVVDLAAVFRLPPRKPEKDRLTPETLGLLYSSLQSQGVRIEKTKAAEERLMNLKNLYEGYLCSLGDFFCLSVPGWIPDPNRVADWQTSLWERSEAFYGDRVRGEGTTSSEEI